MSDGILNSQEWAALWEKVQAADRYKAALEDIASRSCCDEVCIGPCASTRANDALRGTTEPRPAVDPVASERERCARWIEDEGPAYLGHALAPDFEAKKLADGLRKSTEGGSHAR